MIDPLLDHSIRHAVDLTQYSNYVLAKMIRILNLTDADLFYQLGAALEGVDAETFKVQRLDQLLASVRDVNNQAYASLYGNLTEELKAYVGYEGQFQFDLYRSIAPVSFDIAAVVPEQVYAAAMSQPMQGRLLKDWAGGLRDSRLRRVKDTIAVGFTQGKTTADIVRELRGSKTSGYADGLLNTDRRHVEAIVRTAVSHTAQTTRSRFYDENASILGDLIWVSTLDGRTSHECRVRDQQRFTQAHVPVGHQIPWLAGPGRLHFSCRSTSIALLRGQKSLTGTRSSDGGYVNANLSYQDWLKQQSAVVQDEVLGKQRGSMFRAGGLDAGGFENDKGLKASLKDLKVRQERTFNNPSGQFTIYDPGFPRVAPDVSTPARAAAVELENRIRTDERETGALFGPDGKMLLKRTGQPDQVTFYADELRKHPGSVFTHNHPGGGSFSVSDVQNAAFGQFAELRAVAPKYRHLMAPTGKWPAESVIKRTYHEEEAAAKREVDTMLRAGELSISYATAELQHRTWVRAAAKLGLKYTREAS